MTMKRIPQHKASLYIDFGVVLHHITNDSTHNHTPIRYAHQDDYYIFVSSKRQHYLLQTKKARKRLAKKSTILSLLCFLTLLLILSLV